MTLRPYARVYQRSSHWMDCREIFTRMTFMKNVSKIQILLKSGKI